MLELKDFMPINFLKKENFTGSCRGMRFRMGKHQSGDGETTVLQTFIWPEPYSFAATEDEKKQVLESSFDADGIAQAVDWLNQQYAKQKETWKQALKDGMV